MRSWIIPAAAILVLAFLPRLTPAAEVIVVDHAGKEHKIKSWKFTAGTRRLAWLVPASETPKPVEKDPKDKDAKKPAEPPAKPTPAGPEALVVREENSTNFVQGMTTLVPLDRVRSIEYDGEKKTVTVHVATTGKPEDDLKLTGTTKYAGENKLTIEAEVDKGELGIAEVQFRGGVPDKGIRALKFPAPKPAEAPKGRPATFTSSDKKDKSEHQAVNVQVLYQHADGSERLQPNLYFKKTLKIDLAKVKRLHFVPGTMKEPGPCEVSLQDGEEHSLQLLRTPTIDDKPALLVGLLGEVPAGYKIFPTHTLSEARFEAAK